MKFLRGGGDSPSVRAELHQLEEHQKQLDYERDEIERTPSQAMVVPSVDDVKQLARDAVRGLASDSFEFAKVMRTLVGKIFVFPYRLCDGGDVVLRARVRLVVANLLPEKRLQEALALPLERRLTVDLFDSLPQRVKYRESVVARRAKGESERHVATALGITQPAVQKASALDRVMKRLRLNDPYVPLIEPPRTNCAKLHRHLHPRYRFEPLPDYHPEW